MVGLSASVGSTVGEGALFVKSFGERSPRSGASAAGGGGVCVPPWMSGMMIVKTVGTDGMALEGGRSLHMYSAVLVQCLAEDQ